MSLEGQTGDKSGSKSLSDKDILQALVQKVEKLSVELDTVKSRRSRSLGFEVDNDSESQDGDGQAHGRSRSNLSPAQGRRRNARERRAFDFPGLEEEGESEALQAEFSIIQDSLKRVRLPASLKVNIGGARGVKREDQQLVSVLRKSAQYTETLLKLISELSADEVTEEDLKDIFIVLYAQLRHIQDKFTTVTLQGTFGHKVASLYEAVERNPGAYRTRNLDTVRACVGLVAAEQPPQGQGHRPGFQSQGAFRGNRGGFQGRFQYNPRGGPRRFGGAVGDNYGRFVRDNQVPANNYNRQWNPPSYPPPGDNVPNDS